MNFGGILLIVANIEKSKKFYQEVLHQTITMDLNEHVAFENGLALQSNYAGVIGESINTVQGANNFQIYFEVDDIVITESTLKNDTEVVFMHPVKEYPWGQRSIRIYDLDRNIIEIAETMDSVIKSLLTKGYDVNEVSKRTMYPVEYIQKFK
jgi:predicted enzyme related to lactoylglutathione lyase